MLKYKRNNLASLVQLPQRDFKRLFNIVNSLLGRKEDNPMPPARMDEKLAEDFAMFFLDKIDKIRDRFTGIEVYKPRQPDIPKLVKFTPVTPR